MGNKVGFLHAHYSNIQYIEAAFASYNIELVHMVNPVLLELLKEHGQRLVKEKLKEHIRELFSIHVEAVVITCSTYSGLYDDDIDLKVIKIDEPFINYLCNQNREVSLLFTNSAALIQTEAKLSSQLSKLQSDLKYTSIVIPHSFQLIMSGQEEEYNRLIRSFIEQLILSNPSNNKRIAIAQLSMINAAKEVASKYNIEIINPLDYLVIEVLQKLHIKIIK